MIFSELYSVYYNTVAEILRYAAENNVSEREIQLIIDKKAFPDSTLTILPSLKSGKWQLLDKNLSSVLRHLPNMPVTTLEKRWLKSVCDDPRIRLFKVKMPELDNVKPLFTSEDYRIYDRYSDGDCFDNEEYILIFNLLREAVREKRAVEICMLNRCGKEITGIFYPFELEYSVKDNKFRAVAYSDNGKLVWINIGRVKKCSFYQGSQIHTVCAVKEDMRELTFEITDFRNSLERAMLHFAHFEKRVERIIGNKYLLHLKYYENDETEMVIRTLSFGPYIKVTEPEYFVNLIKERLISQKSCGLK